MAELLQLLLAASVFLFTVCSMLAVGLAYTVAEIVVPLRQPTALIRALVANFILVPMLAFLITWVFPLAPGLEIGVVLLGCSAGAPFLIKLTQAAKGDLALSATLLVLLVPVSVVFMPLVVPRLAPEAHVSAGPIAGELATTLILPTLIGLAIRAKASHWAERLRPLMSTTSTVALVVLLVTTVILHVPAIRALGVLPIVAALVLILGGFAIGYLLARPGRKTVLGLGTAKRGIAAATLVASQSVADPDALVMVVVTSVVGIVVLFPVAHWLRKTAGAESRPR